MTMIVPPDPNVSLKWADLRLHHLRPDLALAIAGVIESCEPARPPKTNEIFDGLDGWAD